MGEKKKADLTDEHVIIVGPLAKADEYDQSKFIFHVNHHWLHIGGKIDGLFHRGGVQINAMLAAPEIARLKLLIEGRAHRWHQDKRVTRLEAFALEHGIPHLAIDIVPPKDKINDASDIPWDYVAHREMYADKAAILFSGLISAWVLALTCKAKVVELVGMDLYKNEPQQGPDLKINAASLKKLSKLPNIVMEDRLRERICLAN